jgi:hypothetical protein
MSDEENKTGCGAYVVGVIIFGGIGLWLGGGIGFIIGAVIAISICASESSDKEETKMEKSHPDITDTNDVKEEKYDIDVPPITPKSFNYSFYSKLAPELLAVCITADGEVEESEVEAATLYIENDEYIKDKQSALESLSGNIELFLSAFEKSKAIFKLKISPVIHQAINIDNTLEKERIYILLDSLIDAVQSGDKSQTAKIACKIKGKLNDNPEMTKREAAEEYIRKSGDQEAISILNQMKRNPSQYGEKLKQAAKGNSVMKTALGVFTGMIAANLVMGTINQYQLEQALANFNTVVANIGGIDNLDLGDNEAPFDGTAADNYTETDLAEDYSGNVNDFEGEFASVNDFDTDVAADIDVDAGGDFLSDFLSDFFS